MSDDMQKIYQEIQLRQRRARFKKPELKEEHYSRFGDVVFVCACCAGMILLIVAML